MTDKISYLMTNLPQGWEVKKLGDITEISSGGTPSRNKKEYWENGTIPWVKIKDIKETFISATEEFITKDGLKNSSAKLFRKGTLLYSIFATLGEVAILDIDATTNQAIAGINIKENNVNTLYLMYFLRSIKNEICSKGRGVAQNNLNLSILKQIEIPLPPLKEQIRIVKILDSVFASIDKSMELVKANLLYLEELSQSALDKAFNPLKYTAPYSKDSIFHCHSEVIAKESKINQSHDAQPLESRPLRGAEKEKKGGSSATALLKLEADTARLSPQNAKKQSAFL